ncbi:MAG TPA: hypothetical protein VF261_00700 [Candidatus Saccharimonadales bacterium]
MDGTAAGGSLPGGVVNHKFSFTIDAGKISQSYGSLTFQYCTTADPVVNGVGCYAPPGIDVSSAKVVDETGSGITGFQTVSTASVEDATAPAASQGLTNSVTIGLSAAVAVSTPTTIVEELGPVTNPSTANQTFFVRISAYSSIDGTGTALDSGTVAASTANAVTLTGYMPESLIFCTGHYVPISAVTNLPNCAGATSGSVSFNQLFDPNTTTWATSQMAASTNANQGYAITASGTTLYSGSTPIAAIGATPSVSVPGTAQFGMNLIDDSAPPTPVVTDPTIGVGSADPITYYEADGATPDPDGAAIFPASDQTNYTAAVTTGATGFDGGQDATNHYPTYSFNPTAVGATSATLNTVAESNDTTGVNAGQPGPTNSQRYTATYIVNVPGNQPAGTYVTTLTYICTPTF